MSGRAGFSFIEMLIALGIFTIALLPLLPLITQAQRNAAYAEDNYAAQLHAQGLMTVLRAAAEDPAAALDTVAAEYIQGLEDAPYAYGFWYKEIVFTSKPFAQTVSGSLRGIPGHIITVLIWNEEDRITGRASGVVS